MGELPTEDFTEKLLNQKTFYKKNLTNYTYVLKTKEMLKPQEITTKAGKIKINTANNEN